MSEEMDGPELCAQFCPVHAEQAAHIEAQDAEIARLRKRIQAALDEIEDAGPKALKYAEQELRAALAPKEPSE